MTSYALAGTLADQVQQAYRKTKVLRAEFVQKTTVELLDRTVEEKGELVLARPNRFLIHYQGTKERKYLSDGKQLWIVRPREKEVIENPDQAVSREALVFLSGLGEMEKEFRVSPGKAHSLILIPRSAQSPFKKIILGIDPETRLVREIELFPKSGNRSHYRFSKLRQEESVRDNLFRP